ncbi:MAG TPA: PaaI family thioesterase [Thermoanaerobaculia bacterium]|nr:PaaI family thioesterase [Thermoanaerobaculia bacterium]
MAARTGGEAGTAAAPPVVPEPGWEAVQPLRIEGGRGSFVSGDPEGDRVRVAYFRRAADGALVGRAWLGPGAEGPPGHVHGGATAAVLDEAMGAAAWMAGWVVVAVHLEIDFRRMVPLGTDAWMEARVDRVEGRKVLTRGRLHDAAGEDFATAAGVFVTLDPERFEELLGRVARAMGTGLPELLQEMRRRGFRGVD